MALTTIERKILESARRMIRSRNEDYICYAINLVRVPGADFSEVQSAKVRLKKYVMRKLNGKSNLGDWLANKVGAFSGNRWNTKWMNLTLQRHARVAWITWMLGEEIKVSANVRAAFDEYLKPSPYRYIGIDYDVD